MGLFWDYDKPTHQRVDSARERAKFLVEEAARLIDEVRTSANGHCPAVQHVCWDSVALPWIGTDVDRFSEGEWEAHFRLRAEVHELTRHGVDVGASAAELMANPRARELARKLLPQVLENAEYEALQIKLMRDAKEREQAVRASDNRFAALAQLRRG